MSSSISPASFVAQQRSGNVGYEHDLLNPVDRAKALAEFRRGLEADDQTLEVRGWRARRKYRHAKRAYQKFCTQPHHPAMPTPPSSPETRIVDDDDMPLAQVKAKEAAKSNFHEAEEETREVLQLTVKVARSQKRTITSQLRKIALVLRELDDAKADEKQERTGRQRKVTFSEDGEVMGIGSQASASMDEMVVEDEAADDSDYA